MSVFEEFLVGAKSVFNKAGKKAEKVIGFSKLKIGNAEVRKKISKLLEKLGKLTYESAKGKPYSDVEVKLLVKEVDKLKLEEEKLKKRISEIRNKIECLCCGYENESGSLFCAQCGKKLEKEKFNKDEKNESEVAGPIVENSET